MEDGKRLINRSADTSRVIIVGMECFISRSEVGNIKSRIVKDLASVVSPAFRTMLISFFFFVQLLLQMASPITMQLWFILIDTEILRDVCLVQIELKHYKITAGELAEPDHHQQDRYELFAHQQEYNG